LATPFQESWAKKPMKRMPGHPRYAVGGEHVEG